MQRKRKQKRPGEDAGCLNSRTDPAPRAISRLRYILLCGTILRLSGLLLYDQSFSRRAEDESPVGGAGQGRKARGSTSRKLSANCANWREDGWKARGLLICKLNRHNPMKAHHHSKSGKRGSKKRRSAAVLRSWTALTITSYGWNDLTDDERRAWDARGKTVLSRSRGGRSRRLSGQKCYSKVNTARAYLGLPPLRLPPKPANFSPNPVKGLSIIKVPGGLALKLSVPSAPAEYTKVMGSPPCSPGRRFCADFRYLGLLPAPDGGQSDITEQYIKKFGNPPPGSRVFIQTQQQVDGQHDLPLQTEAIVPGKWKPRRATRAAG